MTGPGQWLAALLLTAAGTDADIQRLAWLSGQWQGCLGSTTMEEQWGPPHAGVMLGTARNRAGERLTSFEFLRIYQAGDSLVFAPQPGGKPSVTFALHAIDDEGLEFRNGEHDFPQFVGYRIGRDGALEVRIGRLDSAPDRALSYRMYPAHSAEARSGCPAN